jgi:L-serine dehydratase
MHAQQNMAFQQEAGRPSQFSIFQLFTIGIGPSSSHTVGPMRAAADFAARVTREGQVVSIQCELFGSLALTGKGHGTDTAIMLGLSGWSPELVDPARVPAIVENIRKNGTLPLCGVRPMAFRERDIVFRMGEFLPGHANAMRFTALLSGGNEVAQTYFSIGGGAILAEGQESPAANVAVSFPFSSASELLAHGLASGLSIAALVWANEQAWRSRRETENFLDAVHAAMMASIERGLLGDGVLPGA